MYKSKNIIPLIFLLIAIASLVINAYSQYYRLKNVTYAEKDHQIVKLIELYGTVFNNYNIILDQLETDLLSDSVVNNWTANTLPTLYKRQLSTVRAIHLFDKEGDQVSVTFKTFARINVNDRIYFQNAYKGIKDNWHGPYIGKNDNEWTFSISRRLEKNGKFLGVVAISGELRELNRLCNMCRSNKAFVIALKDKVSETIITQCSSTTTELTRDKVAVKASKSMPEDTTWSSINSIPYVAIGIAVDDSVIYQQWYNEYLHSFIFFCLSISFAILSIVYYILSHIKIKECLDCIRN